VRPVGDPLVDLFRVQPQDACDDRRDLGRVANLQRVGVDRHRLLTDRELDSRAVVDRAAVGRDVDGLPVLAGRHLAQRLRANPLEPDRTKQRGAEDDREDCEEKADPAVRDPAFHRARRGVRST
jgi:hypothetical protein